MTQTYSKTHTVGESNSVGAEVSLDGPLTKVVGIAVKASYNHTWTFSDSFSISETIGVPAGCTFQLVYIPALLRVTGTFTATIGKTTWTLPDVYFDTPDQTPDAKVAGTGWSYNSYPLAGSPSSNCAPSVTNVSAS